MEATIDVNSNNIVNISDPVNSQDVVTKNYLTNYHNYTKLNKSDDSMFDDLNMVNSKITNLLNPINNQEAATKNDVDNVLNVPNLFISFNFGNTSLTGTSNIVLGVKTLKN